MIRDRVKYGRCQYESRTYENRHYLRVTRSFVEKCDRDPEKKKRLAAAECPLCWYRKSRIGGASVTMRPCAFCEVQLSSGNTCIDLACRDCAANRGICKHCGADVNLRVRRKTEF